MLSSIEKRAVALFRPDTQCPMAVVQDITSSQTRCLESAVCSWEILWEVGPTVHVVQNPVHSVTAKTGSVGRTYGFTVVSHHLLLHFGCTYRTYTSLWNCKNEILSSRKTFTDFFLFFTLLCRWAEKKMF